MNEAVIGMTKGRLKMDNNLHDATNSIIQKVCNNTKRIITC
jgi:hypothetical protein